MTSREKKFLSGQNVSSSFGLLTHLVIYLCNKLYAGFQEPYKNHLKSSRTFITDVRKRRWQTKSHFQNPKTVFIPLLLPFICSSPFSSLPLHETLQTHPVRLHSSHHCYDNPDLAVTSFCGVACPVAVACQRGPKHR